MKLKLPHFLLFTYVIFFIALAIKPYDRDVWVAENLPIVGIVLFLAVTHRKFQFSNLSYIMMSVLIFLHTVGGYFTFERVPFDFITDFFGFERNHYDRIAHFSVGFYAFPVAEYLNRKNLVNSKLLMALFGILSIFTVAAIYEIIEWIYAVTANPTAGIAFLGSQGDIWDAQKDMLADGLGAILSGIIFLKVNKKTKNRIGNG